MNRIRILFFQIHCLLITGVVAQSNSSTSGISLSDYVSIIPRDIMPRESAVFIAGSPFLSDSFLPATINTRRSSFSHLSMRYNIFKDYMEFKEKGSLYILDPKIEIHSVEVNDQVWVVEPLMDKEKARLGFFIILDSSEIKLLRKKVVELEDPVPAIAYTSAQPGKYVHLKDVFYYRLPGNVAKPILNIKNLADEFPGHRKQLSTFIASKKLKTNETDLKELWAYYYQISK